MLLSLIDKGTTPWWWCDICWCHGWKRPLIVHSSRRSPEELISPTLLFAWWDAFPKRWQRQVSSARGVSAWKAGTCQHTTAAGISNDGKTVVLCCYFGNTWLSKWNTRNAAVSSLVRPATDMWLNFNFSRLLHMGQSLSAGDGMLVISNVWNR